ncbi:XdhC family protein [Erwinia mallotivora]|uniref:XdhC family protein n=1 Tax=Erwinia mallotivora TaxID=69222 RepID=UPI0035E4CDE1
MSLFAVACRLEKENVAFALIHIIESRGSTPRHSASMLVAGNGETAGTIGGGKMENLVMEQALEALAEGQARLFHGQLARQGDHAVGADCGGAMTVHIAVYSSRPALFLLGAGHVNRALAQAALPLGYEVIIADPWEENLRHPQLPTACQRVAGDSYSTIIATLPLKESSYVVIATNHQDREVLEQMLWLPCCYLGLLASRKKAQHFRQLLISQGADDLLLQKLHSPVGMDINAETPEEIAISILAEIICHRRSQRCCGGSGAAGSLPTQPGCNVTAE